MTTSSQWTIPPEPIEGVSVTFTAPGDPATKVRHRTGRNRRTGKVVQYSDPKMVEAQRIVAAHYRKARGPGQPGTKGFGVRMDFHVTNRQRRDVDNYVKLVLDALTGLAWVDDSQVTEIAAKVHHQAEEARTEVHVFPTDDLPDYNTRECAHCGTAFRLYDSWSTRKYCSRECSWALRRAQRQRQCKNCDKTFDIGSNTAAQFCGVPCKSQYSTVSVPCAHCTKTVTRARSLVKNPNGNLFCDEECHRLYWNDRRTTAAKGTCVECGGPTSKKTYVRCQPCAIGQKKFRSPGATAKTAT